MSCEKSARASGRLLHTLGLCPLRQLLAVHAGPALEQARQGARQVVTQVHAAARQAAAPLAAGAQAAARDAGAKVKAHAGAAGAAAKRKASAALGAARRSETYARPISAIGRLVRELKATQVSDVATSPDGRFIATTGGDGTVDMWRVADGRAVFSLDPPVAPTAPALTAAGRPTFSGDGKSFAVAGPDGMVRVWRPGDRTPSGIYPTWLGRRERITQIEFSQDGRQILIAAGRNVLVYPNPAPARGALRPITLRHRAPVLTAAFAPDGKVVAGCEDGLVVDWNATSGAPGIPVRYSAPVKRITYSLRGAQAIALGNGEVGIFDTAAQRWLVPQQQVHRKGLEDIAFSPDGAFLVTAGRDGWIKRGQVCDGGLTYVGTYGRDRQGVRRLSFANAGASLITAGADGKVRTWQFTAGL